MCSKRGKATAAQYIVFKHPDPIEEDLVLKRQFHKQKKCLMPGIIAGDPVTQE